MSTALRGQCFRTMSEELGKLTGSSGYWKLETAESASSLETGNGGIGKLIGNWERRRSASSLETRNGGIGNSLKTGNGGVRQARWKLRTAEVGKFISNCSGNWKLPTPESAKSLATGNSEFGELARNCGNNWLGTAELASSLETGNGGVRQARWKLGTAEFGKLVGNWERRSASSSATVVAIGNCERRNRQNQ
jgi:hypothetical protein